MSGNQRPPDHKTVNAERYAPGSFGCHEALHMADVARDFVDRHLCEHPAIEHNPRWAAQAAFAASALYDLYQMIGAEHL